MLDLIEQRQPSRRSKTHCPHGHKYTKENTRYDRHGWRICWTCLTADRKRRTAAKRKCKHREPADPRA
jgi:hypothetical protein